MDRSLREIGIGDVSIPKKMKKIGESYFGRSEAYETALESGDLDALAAAVDRNIFADGNNAAGSRALADYMVAADALLMDQETEAMMAGNIVWPDVKPA